MSGVRTIPMDHVVTGTCGKCGGPIIRLIVYSTTLEFPPHPGPECCMDCGAIPEPHIYETYGPIRKMKEARP